MVFTHPIQMDFIDTGAYTLRMWVDSLNDTLQDFSQEMIAYIELSGIKCDSNILKGHITEPIDIQTYYRRGLNFPRDLAFHPHRSRRELWVINRDVEADGGSTLTLFNAGEDTKQVFGVEMECLSFMALPTALIWA